MEGDAQEVALIVAKEMEDERGTVTSAQRWRDKNERARNSKLALESLKMSH